MFTYLCTLPSKPQIHLLKIVLNSSRLSVEHYYAKDRGLIKWQGCHNNATRHNKKEKGTNMAILV